MSKYTRQHPMAAHSDGGSTPPRSTRVLRLCFAGAPPHHPWLEAAEHPSGPEPVSTDGNSGRASRPPGNAVKLDQTKTPSQNWLR